MKLVKIVAYEACIYFYDIVKKGIWFMET